MMDIDLGEELFEEGELDYSQLNEYYDKSDNYQGSVSDHQGYSQGKQEIQNLIYNNLSLEYDIFLVQEEVKFYQIILKDKQSEIKRLKDMHNKKSVKLSGIVDSIKRANKKIKEVSDGYRLISQKKHQCAAKEENHRNQRLDCQERKNQLYTQYCLMEENYHSLVNQIQTFQGYQMEYNDLRAENEQLKEEIETLEERKKQSEGEISNIAKEERKAQIKKLYERIKFAEKEEARICKDYEHKKKKQKGLEQEEIMITQRTMEINSLYTRISQLKQECKRRKWTKLEREKEYHQLLAQQSKIKKELSRQQSRIEKPRQVQAVQETHQKPTYLHNFKIIDSEADEEIGRSNKHFRSSSQKYNSSESQQQFDELIGRFQKIKSKSKNLT